MTLNAILLISLSTFAHAAWNLMGKRNNPSPSFFFVASLAAGICLLPVIFIFPQMFTLTSRLIWGLLVATGVCQAVYFIGLAGAYRHGDLSVAYPLARALPTLLVMALTAGLGLGRPLSALGIVGIFLVAFGCLLVPIPNFRSLRINNYLNLCCIMAIIAACGTTGYTTIDSEVLRRLRAMPELHMTNLEISLWFMEMETIMTVLALAVYHLFSKRERISLISLKPSTWRYAAITGLIITSTYGLVLFAMGYVSNVSYLVAFRQLSIPLGAMFGIMIQKEPAAPPKITGISAVLLGLVVISFA